jgi:hypothetical protein
MHYKGRWSLLLTGLLAYTCTLFAQATPVVEFISLEQATPVIRSFADLLPPDLPKLPVLNTTSWSSWLQTNDREIRARLDRGEEDTLTNLLRFGVTFTNEYRIDDEYLARYGESTLVNSFAENRARDLVKALAAPNPSEGLVRMRAFLEGKGFALKTPEQRAKARQYLLANLARMREDFLKYRSQTKDETRFQLFKDRGISLDTNLWPDFLLDEHFRQMKEKGLLQKGSVKRVAIIGPGLDFANKEKGNDFYPPQTIQPFAVLDSLLRLGLADINSVELYTFDISQDVNFHIRRAKKNASAGQAYTVQLPWNTDARRDPAYRARFIEYWETLGDQIGRPVTPIPVPKAAAGTKERAVKIRPELVGRMTPVDMNIVFQRMRVASEKAFDLVIGTNIFVYYGEFEQSLARANVATMLKKGGYLLTNDKLPDRVPSGLKVSMTTIQTVARDPDITEYMFCYERAD